MRDFTVGIDPGLKGAVAAIGPDGARVWDTPTYTVKGRRHMDLGKATSYIIGCLVEEPLFVLEGITAMPGRRGKKGVKWAPGEKVEPTAGAVTNFKLGQNFGQWQGILAAFGCRVLIVYPQTWQRAIGLMDMPLPSDVKERRREKAKIMLQWARERWPEVAHQLVNMEHADRAAALLIAEYGRKS